MDVRAFVHVSPEGEEQLSEEEMQDLQKLDKADLCHVAMPRLSCMGMFAAL